MTFSTTSERASFAAGLALLLALAVGCSDSSDFDPFPLEGAWVDVENRDHLLHVSQGDDAGEVGGRVTGTESFDADATTAAFEGTFFERQMDITIARPGGPAELKGELLEGNDLLLLTSRRAEAFLFARR